MQEYDLEIINFEKNFFSNSIKVKALKDCDYIIEWRIFPIKVTILEWEFIEVLLPKRIEFSNNQCYLKDIVTSWNKRSFLHWSWM